MVNLSEIKNRINNSTQDELKTKIKNLQTKSTGKSHTQSLSENV